MAISSKINSDLFHLGGISCLYGMALFVFSMEDVLYHQHRFACADFTTPMIHMGLIVQNNRLVTGLLIGFLTQSINRLIALVVSMHRSDNLFIACEQSLTDCCRVHYHSTSCENDYA